MRSVGGVIGIYCLMIANLAIMHGFDNTPKFLYMTFWDANCTFFIVFFSNFRAYNMDNIFFCFVLWPPNNVRDKRGRG